MRTDLKLKTLLMLFFPEFMHLFFPRFAARIDWSKPFVFLDKELQGVLSESAHVVDLLVRVVTLDGRHEYCLVHIEIEGRKSRKELGVRLHRYLLKLDEKFGLPVMPIALFLNVGGDGLGWSERKISCFGECVDHFTYPYIGLPALDGTKYLETDNPLAWALTGLMNAPPKQRARLKAEALRRTERRRLDAERRAIVVKCVEAFTVLNEQQKRDYEALLKSPEYRKEREMQKTIYDEAEEKGELRGKREGMLEGKREGKLEGKREGMLEGKREGKREVLLLLLETKFGPLPERSRKKVERLKSEEFDDLAKRLALATDRHELGL